MNLRRPRVCGAASILIALLGLACQTAHGQDWYVDGVNGDDDNDGAPEWSDAFKTLMKALEEAGPNEAIWVADATYTSGGSLETDSFLLDGTHFLIYGGFDGVAAEVSIDDRDIAEFETIISAELSGTVNAFHGVHVESTLNGSRIDGFTIRDGIADGADLTNETWGGGVYIDGGNMHLVRCTIIDNVAGEDDVTNGHGGGIMYRRRFGLAGTTVNVVNCVVTNNISYPSGGGVAAADLFGQTFNITNTLVYGNEARGHDETAIGRGGGGHFVSSNDIFFDNCTIVENLATAHDSGGFDRDGEGGRYLRNQRRQRSGVGELDILGESRRQPGARSNAD